MATPIKPSASGKAGIQFAPMNVRSGGKADVNERQSDVRF